MTRPLVPCSDSAACLSGLPRASFTTPITRYLVAVEVVRLAASAGIQIANRIRIPTAGIHANKFLCIVSSHHVSRFSQALYQGVEKRLFDGIDGRFCIGIVERGQLG